MNKRFYSFGDFRLDTHNQRLLHGGEVIKLTLKQFELVLALIENAGDVVSKEVLFEKVWKDVAVADETLTRNISWLRQKLGDGEFIETVPKRGYRFAAQVKAIDQPEIFVEEKTLTRVRVEETLTISDAETRQNRDADSKTDLVPRARAFAPLQVSTSFFIVFCIIAVVAAVSIGFTVYQNYFDRTNRQISFTANIKPLSGARGRENSPAFSPDSKQIVFSWNSSDERENSDIYLQLLGAGEPVRLTDTEVHEHYPVFSPDGTHIAFVRDFKTHGEIVLIPALGGAERTVARVFSGNYSMSFAPDGESIAVVDATGETNEQYAIFTVDLKTGERRRVTANGDFLGETTPRFSSDGKSLAFVRIFPDFTQDLYAVSIGGVNNEPLRLTSDSKTIHSLTWSANGAEIFFVSPRASNRPNIWRIGASGGEPELLSTGGKEITNLAASPDGKFVAFVENVMHSDIYLITAGETSAKPLIATSYIEDIPDYSPDGRRFVFRSNRSGNAETWIADEDGKNLRQITDTKFQVGNARFSPDGTQIAFHARAGENRDIYISPIENGEARPLTFDASYDSLPAWSADGQFIYFASDRTGANQIWRVPANGGDAVQITRGGGFESFASPDGKWLYYIKDSADSGLWRVSATASAKISDESQISGIAEEGFQNIWTLTKKGVYFIASAEKPPAKIKFFDFSTEQTSEIGQIENFASSKYAGMTVSPDGKTILIARFDQIASTIMLAEIK